MKWLKEQVGRDSRRDSKKKIVWWSLSSNASSVPKIQGVYFLIRSSKAGRNIYQIGTLAMQNRHPARQSSNVAKTNG
jgi:hypothetical protein